MEPVWGQRVGKHEEVNVEGNSRRDFLKKAGVAAWTVPAVQVVNMTGALAGDVNTSVTTTSRPPTTPPPPPCEETGFRLKADLEGDGWVWTKGEGAQDCLTGGDWTDLVPTGLPVSIEGNAEYAVVKHDLPDCKIVMAYHKAGSANQGEQCFIGEIGGGGAYAEFTAQQHGISHVELIVECCVEAN